MPFTLRHTLVSEALYPETIASGSSVSFRVSAQGRFHVLYPGRLQPNINATVRHSMRIDTPDTQPPPLPGGIDSPGHPTFPHQPGPPQPLHNGVQVMVEAIPLDVRLYEPNGQLFTRGEVTLADLKKYRDLRGSPLGDWSYSISGQSRTYTPGGAFNESVTDPRGVIDLSVLETVPSTSAAPLVPRTQLVLPVQRFTFDLNRVGHFVATVVNSGIFGLAFNGRLKMRLLDPDGLQVAASTSRTMRCPIALSQLGKSRDAAGHPRLWTLEVSHDQLPTPLGAPSVTATVLGEGRIGTAVLQARIQKVLGPHLFPFIKLVGENRAGGAAAVLTITDVVAAETIDMHGLLDSRLRAEGQSVDIQANVPMGLYHVDPLNYGLSLDVSNARLTSIDATLAPGQGLGATTPAFRLVLTMAGGVNLKWRGLTVADARLSNGSLAIEVGVRIDPDGTPRIVQWVPGAAFNIDFSAVTIAAMLLVLSPLLGGITAGVIHHYVEEFVNTRFTKAIAKLFDDPSMGPRIMMTLFGTHLTYLPPRFEGNDILFEHIAPLEPDLQPRADYRGAIGRTVVHEALGHPTFLPRMMGDTWAATNLEKIDHIVVVMMENRSYDHVLGYRAQAPTNDGKDGLTNELMAAVTASLTTPIFQPTVALAESNQVGIVHPLRKSGFALNAVNLRTRLPKSVGHELDDVKQQLSGQIDGPGGRRINDPNGFVNSFRDKNLGGNVNGVDGVVPFDVLGYYESNPTVVDPNTKKPVNDLPIYAFLAQRFTYSDRYFSSHPGPTLPNRMFSLTGDVQYDRLGTPILDNNHGDNFLLSRAPTIYDILSRNGISWRVYESNPSVTMLRMFARYATDNVNIRPFVELARDAAAGTLPALTVVEPAMHHHPEDDDHPDADMYRGQIFIRKVYQALRSNQAAWQKTLLLITYDEHGGFYDHVVPPIADVLSPPRPDLAEGGVAVAVAGTLQPTVATGGASAAVGHGHFSPQALDVLLGAHEGFPAATPTDRTIEIPYGVRVPTFVISPWVTPGPAPAITLDHCSILKTILARFCGDKKPFLSDRVRASQSFEAFLSAPTPRMDVGMPPTLRALPINARSRVSGSSAITTAPLFRKRLREEQVDFHEVSGRLARMLGR